MRAFDKQDFELEVFNLFVKIAGLRVDTSSIKSLNPPHPDISCNIDGHVRNFELTLITDEAIETKVRRGRSGYTNYKIEIDDVLKIIQKKSSKPYLEESIDLLIHEGATPIDDLWLTDQSDLDRHIQSATERSAFERVWLLDMTNELVRVYQRITGKAGQRVSPSPLMGEGLGRG